MALAAYVEDSCVRYQWEERSLILCRLARWSSIGKLCEDRWQLVGWRNIVIEGLGVFWKGTKPGKGVTFKMQIKNIFNLKKEKKKSPLFQEKLKRIPVMFNEPREIIFITFPKSKRERIKSYCHLRLNIRI